MAGGWREDPHTLPLLRERAATDIDGDVRRAAVEAIAAGWREQPDMVDAGTCPEQIRFTPREKEVARLLAQGMSYKAIAAELLVKVKTVDACINAIYRKLGVSGAVAATKKLLELGLVESASR